MSRLHSLLALLALACAPLLSGCAAGEEAANLGVAGASCLRTPDCKAPLQCISQICTRIGAGVEIDAAGGGLGPGTAGSTGDAASSAQRDTKVPQFVAKLDVLEGADGTAAEPGQPKDVYFPFDAGPDATPSAPDVPAHIPDPFSDCEELGISPKWDGTFMGTIDFALDDPPSYLVEQGLLAVSGDLYFEIKCLEKKLVVAGELQGRGVAEGEVGSHPFAAIISGDYDPSGKSIDAKIRQGEVKLMGLFPVYFEGVFTGAVGADSKFHGLWSGEMTGNSLNVSGEAEGQGAWEAGATF